MSRNQILKADACFFLAKSRPVKNTIPAFFRILSPHNTLDTITYILRILIGRCEAQNNSHFGYFYPTFISSSVIGAISAVKCRNNAA